MSSLLRCILSCAFLRKVFCYIHVYILNPHLLTGRLSRVAADAWNKQQKSFLKNAFICANHTRVENRKSYWYTKMCVYVWESLLVYEVIYLHDLYMMYSNRSKQTAVDWIISMMNGSTSMYVNAPIQGIMMISLSIQVCNWIWDNRCHTKDTRLLLKVVRA